MRTTLIATVAGILAIATLLPLPAAARTMKLKADPAADAARNGSALLHLLESDAVKVDKDADMLLTYQRSTAVSWDSHASMLNLIAETVNDMNTRVGQLESARETLTDLERQELDRIRPAVIELTDCTNDAIKALNPHVSTMPSADYTMDIKALFAKAGELSKEIATFNKYEKAQAQELRAGKALGLTARKAS